jgi:hypothetical protein
MEDSISTIVPATPPQAFSKGPDAVSPRVSNTIPKFIPEYILSKTVHPTPYTGPPEQKPSDKWYLYNIHGHGLFSSHEMKEYKCLATTTISLTPTLTLGLSNVADDKFV